MHVRRFSFGPYAVDASAGELHKNGHRIEIPGKSFEALVALLERPHELVTRQELQQRLWPDGVSVDFENSLNRVVNRLRDALYGAQHDASARFAITDKGRDVLLNWLE